MVGSTSSDIFDDAWVVKLDASGHKLWDKKFGGTNAEAFHSIVSVNGGYVAVGSTSSDDGDVVGKHPGLEPSEDVWLVKIDETGNLIWQKCLGGSGTDQGEAIVKTSSGGYAIAGSTQSNDGDVSGNHGSSSDAWIVEVDGVGNKIWQRTFGGTGQFGDSFFDLIKNPGNEYVAAGGTNSNDGDITGNHGEEDAWVITIKKPTVKY